MGTLVTLIAPAPETTRSDRDVRAAYGSVRSTFLREDLRFSRFRHDSEISRVNASAGGMITISKPFRKVTRAALAAADETNGLFDPTVLPALLAAGYDRDFDEVLAGARLALHPPEPCGRWRDIRLEGCELYLPAGAALDFGGIVKGWTVDRCAKRVAKLVPWALLDAGGDLRLIGSPPGGGLDIGVEDPDDPASEILRLRLREGALATSSVQVRAWGPDLHHIIDPRTGLPARTGVTQATAWAKSSAQAEVRSKWTLLAPEAILDRFPVAVVRDDGVVVTNVTEGAATRKEHHDR
jgi:thiamine biosynthesis lipoprotein